MTLCQRLKLPTREQFALRNKARLSKVAAFGVNTPQTLMVTSSQELHEAIATQLGQTISVSIRLNLDAGIQPCWSRFGFNLESGQAMDAILRIASGGKLRVNGYTVILGRSSWNPLPMLAKSRKW